MSNHQNDDLIYSLKYMYANKCIDEVMYTPCITPRGYKVNDNLKSINECNKPPTMEVCECGLDSIGGIGYHSRWCPKRGKL